MLINRWLSAKEGDGQIVRDLNLHQQISGKIFLVLITNPLSVNTQIFLIYSFWLLRSSCSDISIDMNMFQNTHEEKSFEPLFK